MQISKPLSYGIIALASALSLAACGDSATKQKELELKEKEIELKTQELAAKTAAAAAPVVAAPVAAPAATAVAPAAVAVAPAQGGGRVAYIYAPPSNVRYTPDGQIQCVLSRAGNINVYGFAGTTYDGARQVQWYYTNACGGAQGVIASTQFR